MTKAIITIDDENGTGVHIDVSFDPPMPQTPEERALIKAPLAAVVAGHALMFLRSILEEAEEDNENGKQE